MAVDTRDRRASALREGLLPLPDASLNQGDRQQVLWQYRGILASAATAIVSVDIDFILTINRTASFASTINRTASIVSAINRTVTDTAELS